MMIKRHEIRDRIVDMTLAGASSDELARMVKYSMDVIDAEKKQKVGGEEDGAI